MQNRSMSFGFAEDMDCGEIRKHSLIGKSAASALQKLLDAVKGGEAGVYILMGEYGTGKTLILRKLSLMIGGIHVINLRRGIDISCSNSSNDSSIYAIDNFEMLLQKPLVFGDKVRNIISNAKLLIVSISSSGGPIYGGSIVNISDILMRLENAKKIIVEVDLDDAKKIVESAGIGITVPPLLMKTPGIVIRAFGGKRGSVDDTYMMI
ncbi:MAG: hypothetical protein AT710_03220 [Thermocladium sp. ECH_B]|nr:MAG: hypothetical protein AT710_03220 [Thermocladium sp. ECH_B]